MPGGTTTPTKGGWERLGGCPVRGTLPTSFPGWLLFAPWGLKVGRPWERAWLHASRDLQQVGCSKWTNMIYYRFLKCAICFPLSALFVKWKSSRAVVLLHHYDLCFKDPYVFNENLIVLWSWFPCTSFSIFLPTLVFSVAYLPLLFPKNGFVFNHCWFFFLFQNWTTQVKLPRWDQHQALAAQAEWKLRQLRLPVESRLHLLFLFASWSYFFYNVSLVLKKIIIIIRLLSQANSYLQVKIK